VPAISRMSHCAATMACTGMARPLGRKRLQQQPCGPCLRRQRPRDPKEDHTMARSNTYKLGVVYNADDLSLADMLQYAQMAEEAGIESVWTVEAGRDAFVPLTALASVLQRVRVGTSVAQFARPPVLTALSAMA